MAATEQKMSRMALTAMVVGGMVGAGIFSLPRTFAGATGPLGALIAWVIAGTGMYMLARVFQSLAERKPNIDAGVFAIVLESVMPATARELTASLSVPTIGIGCGDHTCDGEIAVITDVLGSFPWFVPPFARPEADLANSIRNAASQYIARVQNR